MHHRERITQEGQRTYYPEMNLGNRELLLKVTNMEAGPKEFKTSEYRPLMNAKEVEQEFGIEGATLDIIIKLPAKESVTGRTPERMELSQLFCFRTQTAEGPKYHILTNKQLDLYRNNEFFHGTIDQINDPTTPVISKNESMVIGRGKDAWLPAAYDMVDPEESSYISRQQAVLSVEEDGLHVWDEGSYNGTGIIHSRDFIAQASASPDAFESTQEHLGPDSY